MITIDGLPTHPGEILEEEFLKPLLITKKTLAEHLGIPVERINEIVQGKGGITPDVAWLFAQAFQTSPEFWMNLQTNYDLAVSKPQKQLLPLVN